MAKSINIKHVNIPMRLEKKLKLSSLIPAKVGVQYEFDIDGIKCEQVVDNLILIKSQQPVNKLPNV